jgi:hypothetical protein
MREVIVQMQHATTPTPPRVERTDGSVQCIAALHEGLPIRRTGQTRNDAGEKTEDAETLDKIEAGESKKVRPLLRSKVGPTKLVFPGSVEQAEPIPAK